MIPWVGSRTALAAIVVFVAALAAIVTSPVAGLVRADMTPAVQVVIGGELVPQQVDRERRSPDKEQIWPVVTHHLVREVDVPSRA